MGAVPNAITLAGYSLGLWWCFGGPTWAGIASIAADELDGYVARELDAESDVGRVLDQAADAALVPLALMRLGKATGTGLAPLIAAPPLLYAHAVVHGHDELPPLGSARAGVMIMTMLLERLR